jgi:hypothetical protein
MNDANSFWLEEVRSKVWKRKDLELVLFRTVKVTRDHYTELQKRLEEQHPGRDSPEYDGREHNVQSVKLDFLRSITPLAPGHLDSNEDPSRVLGDGDNDDAEASNQDGSYINSLFPSTLSFLDLLPLDLKAKVPTRLPLPLFLLQEYDHISAHRGRTSKQSRDS